jgi:hypothetical protein
MVNGLSRQSLPPVWIGMNIEAIEAAFQKIRSESNIAPAIINEFIRNLYASETKHWALQPIKYSKLAGIQSQDSLAIFLMGLNEGIFRPDFIHFCPNCRLILNRFLDLSDIEETHTLCSCCSTRSEILLDSNIAVQFRLSDQYLREPTVFPIDFLEKYFLQTSIQNTDKDSFFQSRMIRSFFHIGLKDTHKMRIHPKSNKVYQILAPNLNSSIFIRFNENLHQPFQDHKITIKLTRNGFAPAELSLPLGPYIFKIENVSDEQRDICLLRPYWDEYEALPIENYKIYPAHALLHHKLFLHKSNKMDFPPLHANKLPALSCQINEVEKIYTSLDDIHSHKLLKRIEDLFQEAIERSGGSIVESKEGKMRAVFLNNQMAINASLDILTRSRLLKENLRKERIEVSFIQAVFCGKGLLVSGFQGAFYSGVTTRVMDAMLKHCRPMDIIISESAFKDEDFDTTLQNYQIQKFIEKMKLDELEESMKVWRLCYA